MATVVPKTIAKGKGWMLILWETMLVGDVGQPQRVPNYADKTVHVEGSFSGGATFTIEGSNEDVAAPIAWIGLTDPQGTAISKTVDAIEAILENTLQIRPVVTSGDGSTDINVYLLCATPRSGA